MADTTKKYSMEDLFADYGINYANPEDYAAKAKETTLAKYASDRTDLANTTNQYYNNLYNTQNTVMDTIRQSNAQAVASGASKGVQAATTLSALLGLQNESVQGATELANESIKLAQDETAAVLEAEQKARDAAANQNIQSLSIIPNIKNANTAEWTAFKDAYFQAEADDKPGLATQFLDKLWGLDTSTQQSNSTTNSTTNNTTNSTPSTIEATNPDNVRIIDLDRSETWDYIDQWDVGYKNGKPEMKGDAGTYVKTILEDAKAGKIKPGQVVNFNYGNVASSNYGGSTLSYTYLGENKWERVADQTPTATNMYIPDNYRVYSYNTTGSGAQYQIIKK